MSFPGIPELLLILAVVLLIFGPKRLKSIGSDLGNAIKGFRKAVTDDEQKPPVDPNILEGKVEGAPDEPAAAQPKAEAQNAKV